MRDLVADIIRRDYGKFLPGAVTLRDLSIKRDSRFGFHVVTSPRLICTLKTIGHDDRTVETKLFLKSRLNEFHIPEPLYLDSEHSLLFLRYWSGETFLSMFYRFVLTGRSRGVSILEDYVKNAAKWLVDFQNINLCEKEEVPFEILNFEEQVSGVGYLTGSVRQRIIAKMRGLVGTLPTLRETYVHDQYLFRNILYNSGEVCVVDFPHFRSGWPLYDFFSFYTGLERLKQYPLIPNPTADLMKSIFARTYFAEKGMGYDARAFDNLWAFFIVAYVGKRYRNKDIGSIRGIVNNIFIKKMFDKLREWCET
jgi:hypothetical protein